MQDYQWFSWDCTVRKKVASSIRPNSALQINPVSNRMHSFRTQWGKRKKSGFFFCSFSFTNVCCQSYKLSTFPHWYQQHNSQTKKGESGCNSKKSNPSPNCDKVNCKSLLHTKAFYLSLGYAHYEISFAPSIWCRIPDSDD